ncbi:MAG TPA: hypothetical protein IAA58_08790 [Candidatus Gallacutalibacter stercoravium]|nr:hypothetical protein [Candidatus Gallacutalibacter stercoravium]
MHVVLKRILVGLVALVVVAAIAAGVVFYLAKQDDNAGKHQAEPSLDLLTKGLVAAGTGEEVAVTQEEINGFLAYWLQQQEQQGDFALRGVYLTLGQEEGNIELYLPVTYKGIELGVTAQANLTYNAAAKQFRIEVQQVHVGRLPVSPQWAVAFLNGHLPGMVSVDATALLVDASALKVTVNEQTPPLELVAFSISGGQAHLQTTGLLEAIMDYVGQMAAQLPGGDSELVQRWLDNLGDDVKEFLQGLQQE